MSFFFCHVFSQRFRNSCKFRIFQLIHITNLFISGFLSSRLPLKGKPMFFFCLHINNTTLHLLLQDNIQMQNTESPPSSNWQQAQGLRNKNNAINIAILFFVIFPSIKNKTYGKFSISHSLYFSRHKIKQNLFVLISKNLSIIFPQGSDIDGRNYSEKH